MYKIAGERSENCFERCKKFIGDDNFLTDGHEISEKKLKLLGYVGGGGRGRVVKASVIEEKNYFNKAKHISIRNQFEY